MNLRTFFGVIGVLTLSASTTFGQAKKSYVIGLVAKSQGNPVFQAARPPSDYKNTPSGNGG